MFRLQFRRLFGISAVAFMISLSSVADAQDPANRGRKYTPPVNTAHVSVAVIKDSNGKPVENAAVVFHMVGEEGKGNMELKTNEEGKAIIDVIPLGDTVTLQVIASGFQTFGEDYKIDTGSKDIVVKLKRPGAQYSTYTHSGSGTQANPAAPAGAPQNSNSQAPPKQ